MESILKLYHTITDEGTNFVRPTIIVICGMLLLNLPTVLYKMKMSILGIVYFTMCFDKSWKKPVDPGSIFGPHISQGLPIERKTIYFIRHAESTWNETFNKGSHRSTQTFIIGFIPGIIKSLCYEFYLLLSGKMDSWFLDSPLSYYGLTQVEEMASFLKDKPLKSTTSTTDDATKTSENDNDDKTTTTTTTTTTTAIDNNDTCVISSTVDDNSDIDYHMRVLRGYPGAPKSKIISSPLRRAVATLSCGLSDRLQRRPTDKILIVPSLQEISRNPDTLSITPPSTSTATTSSTPTIQASWIEKQYTSIGFQSIFNNQIDMSLYKGNKPLDTNGYKRMKEFCEFVFSSSTSTSSTSGIKEQYIIVGGHSIWFKYFFQTFLPYSVQHPSKQKKIVNCGIIVFDLLKAETKRGPMYMIDPKTIKTIYGGYS